MTDMNMIITQDIIKKPYVQCDATKEEKARDSIFSHTLKLVRKSPVHEYCGNQPRVARPF